jgi:hypothetical protein
LPVEVREQESFGLVASAGSSSDLIRAAVAPFCAMVVRRSLIEADLSDILLRLGRRLVVQGHDRYASDSPDPLQQASDQPSASAPRSTSGA